MSEIQLDHLRSRVAGSVDPVGAFVAVWLVGGSGGTGRSGQTRRQGTSRPINRVHSSHERLQSAIRQARCCQDSGPTSYRSTPLTLRAPSHPAARVLLSGLKATLRTNPSRPRAGRRAGDARRRHTGSLCCRSGGAAKRADCQNTLSCFSNLSPESEGRSGKEVKGIRGKSWRGENRRRCHGTTAGTSNGTPSGGPPAESRTTRPEGDECTFHLYIQIYL